MSSEVWSEKAERLRAELEHLNSALLDGFDDSPKTRRELEEATIARFLRAEFSDEAVEDTTTMPLFPVGNESAAKR